MKIKYLLLLNFMMFIHPGTAAGTGPTYGTEEIALENPRLYMGFDKHTGKLVSLVNKETQDDYIKDIWGGNLFRLYVNTGTMPELAAGAHNRDYGGIIIEPESCAFRDYSFTEKENAKGLLLRYRHADLQVLIEVEVTLAEDAPFFDGTLTVKNEGAVAHTVFAAFPYLTGVQIGKDPESNLAVHMWDRGYPGIKAWAKESGGVYGRDVAMQWQAVYDPTRKEGLAFIAMDRQFSNKILTCFPGGGMASLYFDQHHIQPGKNLSWPSARILAYSGNWRTAARAYRNWLEESMTVRKVPAWYENKVTSRGSTWFPAKEVVEANKKSSDTLLFTSFEQIHDLFGNTYFDIMEFAMWNEGVNQWPETYGPWMSSGFIDFRSDLGGLEAFKKGVERCHKYGRKVAMYVAGYGARTSSPVFEGEWERFAIKDEKGEPRMDYRKGGEAYGAFNCPGYKPWQDNLIRVCSMLAKAGVDAIRLDEFGFPFRPCFNEAHNHKSPYNSHQWMRTLLERVREATDRINPRLVITTEFFMDYFHEFANGALVMDSPGREVDAMKIAIPDYLPLSYHASASEAAITGAIMSKTTSQRNNWAWAHVGVEKPDDYQEDFVKDLKWHEIYPSFSAAIARGEIMEWDPVAENDPKWMGHLWKSKDYWVLTGGHVDATPLPVNPLKITLPELDKNIQLAYEINIETLAMREVAIEKENGGHFVLLNSPVSLVFFPLPSCPPLPLVRQREEREVSEVSQEGSIIEVSATLFAPWKKRGAMPDVRDISLQAPGFKVTRVSNKKNRKEDGVGFIIDIPAGTTINNYSFTISGDCLPVKRWFTVHNHQRL